MSEQSRRLQQAHNQIGQVLNDINVQMSLIYEQLAQMNEPEEKTYSIEWFMDELKSYFSHNFIASVGDPDDLIEFEGYSEYGGYKVCASLDESALESSINNQITDFFDEFNLHLEDLYSKSNNEEEE